MVWVLVNVLLLMVARHHLNIRWWDRRFLGWLLPTVVTFIVGIGIRESGIEIGAAALVPHLCSRHFLAVGQRERVAKIGKRMRLGSP